MKKWIMTIVFALAFIGGFLAIKYYRDTTMKISISIENDRVPVGKEPKLGIHAVANGTYREESIELEPVVTGEIDYRKVGQYTISVKADCRRAHKTEEFVITVYDDVAPVITLKQTEGFYTLPGREYEEEGFTASDNYDGDLTDDVVRTVADGKIIYEVTDSNGNSTKVERTVFYDDPIPPRIVLKGLPEMTVERRTTFTDPGALAEDNCDGDISERISVSGTVDTTQNGDYELSYKVSDAFGNVSELCRVVHVVDPVKRIGAEEEAKGKVIYLTFDDGPSQYTEQLLDVLDKYNVKATFFVVKTGIKNCDEIIKREYDSGHSVGIHCYVHDYKKIYSSENAYREDFNKMADYVESITGERPVLFRFPGGSSNAVSKKYCKGLMTTLTKKMPAEGYYYFDWNVMSGDSEAQAISTEQVYKNVINGVSGRNVSVVLQHDIKGFSVKAVEDIIVWGLENGYTFMPLDETSYGAHHGLNN